MTKKDIIKRKCIVTNKIVPLKELVRFVLLKDGTILVDKDNKILGRGAYCMNDLQIIEIVFSKKLLNKSFKRNISSETYETLRKEVNIYVKEQTKEKNF